ncbi:MAG: thymidine kinase [Sarcina sp.]
MAKLYFKTGTMGSGKSLDLLRCNYNYTEREKNPLVLKPSLDTRDKCNITSRTGMNCEALTVKECDSLVEKIQNENIKNQIDVVIVDEVQFLTEKQIEELQDIVYDLNIPVIAYGLTTNFKGYLFPSIARLLSLADKIESVKSVCWCGKKAKQNARIVDGKMVVDGELVQIGGNESYVALCNKHFRDMDLGN